MQQVSVLETNIGSSTTGNSSNGQVIFNDNGTLRGDADMTFNTALNRLIVSSLEVSATATITGNLTVDTNTLFVDSANNRVGIGTATPAATLIVRDGLNRNLLVASDATQLGSSGIAIGGFTDGAAGYAPLSIISSSTQFGINGTTAMTLNATGLGVGASPATRLHIQNTGDVYARIATTSVSKAGVQFSANGVVRSHLLYDDGAGTTYLTTGTSFGGSGQALAIQSGTSLNIFTNNQLATAQMTVDTSGNVGIGVTPSAKLDVVVTSADGVRVKNTLANSAYSNRFHISDNTGIALVGYCPSYVGGTNFGVGANGQSIVSDSAGPLAIGTNTAQSLFLGSNGVTRITLDSSGNVISNVPATAPTLGIDRQMVFNLTSNTNLRISVRGSDGVTRVANITLA